MMRTLQVVPPHVTVSASPTQQSDVYMYGTLLYELFAEAPPFATQHPHAVILQVGRRRQPSTEDLQCTQNLKVGRRMRFIFISWIGQDKKGKNVVAIFTEE